MELILTNKPPRGFFLIQGRRPCFFIPGRARTKQAARIHPSRQGVNESQRTQGGANRKPFQTCQKAGAHKQRRDRPGDRRRHRRGPFHQINIFLLFPYWHHTAPPQKVNKKQSTHGQNKKSAEIREICPYFSKFAPSVDAGNTAEIRVFCLI